MANKPEQIGLISSAVPLVFGGARFIVDWLAQKLRAQGHEVDVIYLPSSDEPDELLEQMLAFQLIDFDSRFDRIITFRPPAHMARHRRKVCWFIHHVRSFYDLWDNPEFSGIPRNAHYSALRDAVHRADTIALSESHRLFTNSKIVSHRLAEFNGLDIEVLYPPIADPERFISGDLGDEVVCICRMEPHKRQHLLVEAMRYTRSRVRLRLCGLSSSEKYVRSLQEVVRRHDLQGKVTLEYRWISEEEKAAFLAGCLAAAYVPFDEDSYGYPTLEAAHAQRCTLTLDDSGGVSELVEHQYTGLVASASPQAVAESLDKLFDDRVATATMGKAARARIETLGISWNRVIDRLLS